ncbi:MAG: hypothetical protein QOI41_5281 [Myxococcales bacterium]|nr:hypothetical protein [Myxococcales bacterium]
MTRANSFSNGSLAALPSDGVNTMTLFLRASVLVVLAASSLAACDGQSLDGGTRHAFFVRAALAPPVHTSDQTSACVYTADPTNAVLFKGTADLGVADGYQLTLLLQGSDATVATSVTGAQVVLATPDGTTVREFSLVTTGFIDPGKNAVVSLTAIDAPSRDLLLATVPNRVAKATVVANVTLTGRDPAGGSDVSSPVFRFPIDVCNGCLVDFSTGNDNTARMQPNCLAPRPASVPLPCFVGQDEAVACQLCIGSRPACDPAMLSP